MTSIQELENLIVANVGLTVVALMMENIATTKRRGTRKKLHFKNVWVEAITTVWTLDEIQETQGNNG